MFPGKSNNGIEADTSDALGITSYTRVDIREETLFSTVIAPVAKTATNAIGNTRLFFINYNAPFMSMRKCIPGFCEKVGAGTIVENSQHIKRNTKPRTE
jgi:hypothetical protein